ncbi:unnamed protein product [Nezara viridula]|uniref:Uncharacterized protein n=1 Tax=Nezara viridula TaxID=85310 RepID=A0A9P0MPA8_NEZVI|nr:unnamed protein product [Nezara viridula]
MNASLEIRDNFGNAAIHFAAWDGNIKVIKMLYGHDADFNGKRENRKTPLVFVVRKDGKKSIKVLSKELKIVCNEMFEFERKKNSLCNVNPLGTRSRPGNSQNCLEQPVLREVHDVIPIHYAAALHVASYYGLKDLVGLLISYGASLGVQRDKRRYSSFHSACDNSHVEVLKLLLDSPSNKSCGDINGTTPLHIACEKGLFPIA